MEQSPSAKPRVLLADDHVAFLEWLSAFLTGPFEIVGIARDGRQALDLARRLCPDVIVLDVAMPELDGFRTLEHLRREGLESRVVFLTMHGDDEFVRAAIDAGAQGYVLKSRIYLDLVSAIDHAIAGRLFVPSVTSLSAVPGSGHAVTFHANDGQLLDQVSQLLSATLRSGEPVAVVACEAVRAGLAERLQARQQNVAMLAGRGLYIADSDVALSDVMRNGTPDTNRLADLAHSLDQMRVAAPRGAQSRLTIFGDLTVSLCRQGHFAAALELERTWNLVTRALPFLTICSYPIACFEPPHARDQHARVCAEHSAVTSGMSVDGPQHRLGAI